MGDTRPLHVRAVIPHFYCGSSDATLSLGEGFGSRQKGSRSRRVAAFHRCLHGLLNLRRMQKDWILDLRTAQPMCTPLSSEVPGYPEINVEIVVVISGNEALFDVIEYLRPQVKVLRVDLDDPRHLGLRARDYLIHHSNPADLNLYLEDDLVIYDPFLPEKILWMARQSQNRCVLLPHRYELTRRPGSPPRLYIDGPIDPEPMASWHQPTPNVASGRFRGGPLVQFDCPMNPHSGFFGLNRDQVFELRTLPLPIEGFVGPLETAASLSVGIAFKLLKPSMESRDFLAIEHAHPSYLGYLLASSSEVIS